MTYLERVDEITALLEELVEISAEIRTPEVRDTMMEEDVAHMLVLIDVCSKRIKATKENLDAALNVILPQDTPVEISDLDVSIEKRISAPKKNWDHEGLLSVAIEAILERERDPLDGTINTPYPVLMAEIFRYAAVSYWRVKPLKELGVNANDFCELGDRKVSFQITRQQTNERQATYDDIDFFE